MNTEMHPFLILIRDTFVDARGAAHRVLALPLTKSQVWQGCAVVSILSVLLIYLSAVYSPEALIVIPGEMRAFPLAAAIAMAAVLIGLAVSFDRVGRLFGGAGGFDGALKLVVWGQFVMALLQAVQTGLLFVAPFLSALVGLFGFVFQFWLMAQFAVALHGVGSSGKGFVVAMLSYFMLAILIICAGFLLGFSPVMEIPNV